MRSYIIALFVFLFVTVSLAGGGKKYGKALTLKETTKISEILAKPEAYNGKRLLVEGSIVDVCKERGCWIKIASDKEFESLTFKVDDGVIVFPLDAKGKKAHGEGVLALRADAPNGGADPGPRAGRLPTDRPASDAAQRDGGDMVGSPRGKPGVR